MHKALCLVQEPLANVNSIIGITVISLPYLRKTAHQNNDKLDMRGSGTKIARVKKLCHLSQPNMVYEDGVWIPVRNNKRYHK